MKLFYKTIIAIILYALLAIPDSINILPLQNLDDVSATSKWWSLYAQNLVKFRITNSQNHINQYNKHKDLLDKHLNVLELQLSDPNSPLLDSIQYHINKLSVLTSLIPEKINEFESDLSKWRQLIKYQSKFWNTSSKNTKTKLYQLITESRLAMQSALIQTNHQPSSWASPVFNNDLEAVQIKNINFKSGDIIVFNLIYEKELPLRLIRNLPNAYKHLGSVYINNSEALLTYIDYKKGLQSVPLGMLLKEIAPNGIVLRLRNDIPEIINNPNLPYLTATVIKNMAETGTYKYDYNYDSDTKSNLYDWELFYNVYKTFDLELNLQKLESNPFLYTSNLKESHTEPYELEFDYNFNVVGEWYDPKFLYDDRIITAATSITLSNNISHYYNPLLLPLYRIVKFYSFIANHFTSNIPIPAGVSAQTQLVNNIIKTQQNKVIKKLKSELALYELNQNHKATFLKILQAAKEVKDE